MRNHTSGLARDLEVLEVLSFAEAFTNGGLGVNRVATLTERDKGQISRVLKTLAESGLVDRDKETLRYSLGPRLYSMAMRTKEAHLALLSESRLFELVAQTHETAHLNVLRGGRVLTTKTVVAAQALRRSGWDGIVSAAGSTASGRAMLSGLSNEEIKLWWLEHAQDDPLPALKNAFTKALEPINRKVKRQLPAKNIKAFLAIMQEVRDLGYAISDGEYQPGIVDAAAPVRDSSNMIVAAISTGVPKERIGNQFDPLGQMVSGAALRFSTDLGAPIIGPA
jgi:DNA-binding IclR family transcriptional regulator